MPTNSYGLNDGSEQIASSPNQKAVETSYQMSRHSYQIYFPKISPNPGQ